MSTDTENSKSEGMEGEEKVSKEEPKPDSKVKMEDKKDESGDRKEKEAPKRRGKAKESKKEVKSETEEEPTEENGDEKDSDGKVPLLDQPLELSGTRERKKVQRFAAEYNLEPKDTGVVEIPEGKGTPLGSIPRVEGSIQKSKLENLKPLHRVLFNRFGKADSVKNNISHFRGFDFETDSEQYTKKLTFLQKLDVKSLRTICFTLDLAATAKREVLAEQILTFLMEPKDSGKPTGKKRPKRSHANNKSYSESDEETEKRPRPRGKGKRANLKEESSADEPEPEPEHEHENENENETEKPESKKKAKAERKRKDAEESKEQENNTGDEGNEKDEEYNNEEGESGDESDEPKSKAKKGGSRKNSKKPASKKGNAKKPAPKKTEKKPPPKKRASNSDDDEEEDESSGDEPLAKKSKSPPTDEEIKSYLKEILEGADLEETTMKIVCKKVYAHYPEFDLAHKKDFIKTTVKSLIST